MRIAPTGANNEGIKAITVTENIWMYGVWLCNVDVWDTTNHGSEYSLLHTFDLSPIVGKWWKDDDGNRHSTLIPSPWHVCGRTEGNQVTFKVWAGDNPEPAWNF